MSGTLEMRETPLSDTPIEQVQEHSEPNERIIPLSNVSDQFPPTQRETQVQRSLKKWTYMIEMER